MALDTLSDGIGSSMDLLLADAATYLDAGGDPKKLLGYVVGRLMNLDDRVARAVEHNYATARYCRKFARQRKRLDEPVLVGK